MCHQCRFMASPFLFIAKSKRLQRRMYHRYNWVAELQLSLDPKIRAPPPLFFSSLIYFCLWTELSVSVHRAEKQCKYGEVMQWGCWWQIRSSRASSPPFWWYGHLPWLSPLVAQGHLARLQEALQMLWPCFIFLLRAFSVPPLCAHLTLKRQAHILNKRLLKVLHIAQ